MACRIGACAYDADTAAWHVAHVTEPFACSGFCAVTGSAAANHNSSHAGFLAQPVLTRPRRLSSQPKANPPLMVCVVESSFTNVGSGQSHMRFQVVRISLEDLIQQLASAFCISRFD